MHPICENKLIGMTTVVLKWCCRGEIRYFFGKYMKSMHPKSIKSANGMHSEKIKKFSCIPKVKKGKNG
jgi:hypothetical protein